MQDHVKLILMYGKLILICDIYPVELILGKKRE